MPKAVFDTTVLVSAFITPVAGGAAFDLLDLARQGRIDLALSDAILVETRNVLARARLRRRYGFDDAAVDAFMRLLTGIATMVTDLPTVAAVRDPMDDVIVATALAAEAELLVTRDKDLLDLMTYQTVEMITPEELLGRLRG